VALVAGQVVGHIQYIPVCPGEDDREVQGAELGPMAVLPAFQ
jgi:predicted N-acetyltransferase YhbS